MKLMVCKSLLVLGAMTLSTSAFASNRVALVIGNGDYVHASELPNPPKDAVAVAAALERIGFEVFKGVDLTIDQSRDLIGDYVQALDGADTGLVFYAGHGIQVEGENYILPVDASLENKSDLRFNVVSLGDLVEDSSDPGRTNIYILDACRNNPLSRSFSRKSRSTVGQGLARLSAGTGTMIAFATAPDDVALDGVGDNSPFTQALLNHIETPGLEINQMMTRVRADVYDSTGEQQLPWTNSALLGEFFFLPGDGQDPPPQTRIIKPAPTPVAVAPTPQPAPTPVADSRPKPKGFDMVLCEASAGASWAGERILMYSQCEQIGGSWRAIQ